MLAAFRVKEHVVDKISESAQKVPELSNSPHLLLISNFPEHILAEAAQLCNTHANTKGIFLSHQ